MRTQLNYLLLITLCTFGCSTENKKYIDLRLWYDQPAVNWNEDLPVGNGRLGSMVFGGVVTERIQFNEETLWDGQPQDYSHPGAYEYLGELRQLDFDTEKGKTYSFNGQLESLE